MRIRSESWRGALARGMAALMAIIALGNGRWATASPADVFCRSARDWGGAAEGVRAPCGRCLGLRPDGRADVQLSDPGTPWAKWHGGAVRAVLFVASADLRWHRRGLEPLDPGDPRGHVAARLEAARSSRSVTSRQLASSVYKMCRWCPRADPCSTEHVLELTRLHRNRRRSRRGHRPIACCPNWRLAWSDGGYQGNLPGVRCGYRSKRRNSYQHNHGSLAKVVRHVVLQRE